MSKLQRSTKQPVKKRAISMRGFREYVQLRNAENFVDHCNLNVGLNLPNINVTKKKGRENKPKKETKKGT